jgi:hypothetical protein
VEPRRPDPSSLRTEEWKLPHERGVHDRYGPPDVLRLEAVNGRH